MMEKEEILKLSKAENKLQDERGRLYETKCYAYALYVINVVCFALFITMDWVFHDEFMIKIGTFSINLGAVFMFPFVCGLGSCNLFRFYYFRKWQNLVGAILSLGIFIICVIKMFMSALMLW